MNSCTLSEPLPSTSSFLKRLPSRRISSASTTESRKRSRAQHGQQRYMSRTAPREWTSCSPEQTNAPELNIDEARSAPLLLTMLEGYLICSSGRRERRVVLYSKQIIYEYVLAYEHDESIAAIFCFLRLDLDGNETCCHDRGRRDGNNLRNYFAMTTSFVMCFFFN